MKKLWMLCLMLLVTVSVYAGQTILYYNSEPGDYIGQGQEHYYTTQDLDFNVSINYDNGVNFWMTSMPIWWGANFAAPFNAQLSVGIYENATRFPFQASDEPGLNFSGCGRGCNQLTGRFEIKEAVYNSAGNVESFAVDFEQHCEGHEPGLYGYIRYNSDVPIPTMLPTKIILENALNFEGCVEATGPDGSLINLTAENAQENPFYAFEWSTSTGEVGFGDSFTFELGLNQNASVFLTTIDTSTGEMVTSTLLVCVSDTTPPSITILSPSEGEVFIGNNMFLEVVITDIVDKNIDSYKVTIGNTTSYMLDSESNSSRVKLFKPSPESGSVPSEITVNAQDESDNNATESIVVFKQHDNRKK